MSPCRCWVNPFICRLRVNVSGVIGTLDESPQRCLGFLQHASTWRNPPPIPQPPHQHHHSPPSPSSPAHPSSFSSSSSLINLIFHKFSILTWHHRPQLYPELSAKSLENSFFYCLSSFFFYLPFFFSQGLTERGVDLNISHWCHFSLSVMLPTKTGVGTWILTF